MAGVLPLRVREEGGRVVAQDGLVAVAFMHRRHADAAAAVGEAFDAFVDWVGEDALDWVHAEGESFKPLSTARRLRLRARLTAEAGSQRPSERFAFKGADHVMDPGDYRFEYWGSDTEIPSTLELWLPTEFAQGMDPVELAGRLLDVFSPLPLSSGYASLGFNFEEWAMVGMEPIVNRLAFRHPGLDVHLTWATACGLQPDQIRGAYWLTILGQELLAGYSAASDRLGQLAETDGVRVVRGENRPTAVLAEDELIAGDLNFGKGLPATRAVANALRDICLIQDTNAFGFAGVDPVQRFVDWQERHFDDV